MDREIKFRVWDKIQNKFFLPWCHGGLLCNICGDAKLIFSLYNLEYKYIEGKTINRFITQQFIGLKDKNGVDIYEGDVLKYNMAQKEETESTYLVLWNETTAAFIYESLTHRSYFFTFDYDENEQMEVIGNRFESPELIK